MQFVAVALGVPILLAAIALIFLAIELFRDDEEDAGEVAVFREQLSRPFAESVQRTKALAWIGLAVIGMASLPGAAFATDYTDTIGLFKQAGASAAYFKSSYGYAVFPTIGEGGFVVGGAHGKGRVYEHDRYAGDTTMSQVSLGFQLGGQAFSEIIFFETREDLVRFESGKFALGAQAGAVAITAGASASASTAGTGASASGTDQNATTTGHYQDGIAIFTIAKGGLMYEAAVAGQKFSYEAR